MSYVMELGGIDLKKKHILLIAASFTVHIVLMVSILLIIMKPDNTDYALWLKNHYDVQCLDVTCDSFEVEAENENGKDKQITMITAKESYTSGVFTMRKDVAYRNLEDPTYHLDLKVRGFFNEFSIINEEVSLPSK
ncbi:hypothetical protein N780_15555 [Pontibacillus chungwhensis BH030062]|uniref:Uncharacterized protein n=1 Tax=Pontibacillus chungwhensis BH030062 TaxID=1385513 RepID=A0A0A2UYZ1_9BACI|nr:hypothetical protein [Pontibacillus chungwhensis]KGP91988.1 hypothetical protein N780_15555 [Pontibacillus chungwhensis BH030062]